MADSKITGLTDLPAVVDADVLAIVDDVPGTPITKKVTVKNLNAERKGSDIASATTTDIGASDGKYVDITGTTTITGLGTVAEGTRRICQFDGALILTHNATSLILPSSANITTVAGDVAIFVSLGSGNWKCVGYTRADGTALVSAGGGGEVSTTIYASEASTSALGSTNLARLNTYTVIMEFTDATDESWYSEHVVPDGADGLGISKIELLYYNEVSSAVLRFIVNTVHYDYTDGGTVTTDSGNSMVSYSTNASTSVTGIANFTSTESFSGLPATMSKGDTVVVAIERRGSNASDTYNAILKAFGVRITYA